MTSISELSSVDADNSRAIDLLLSADRCVPFVGAGLSAPSGLPTWSKLLADEARRLPEAHRVPILKLVSDAEYEAAAQGLIDALGGTGFQRRLEQLVHGASHDYKVGSAVTTIAERYAGPVITTNFDGVIECAFRKALRPLSVVNGMQPDLFATALTSNQPVLVKIHGDAADRTFRVLSHQEYEAGYGARGAIASSPGPLASQLRRLFVQKSVLFIGCSLVSDRTMDILELVNADLPPPPHHFALVEKPSDEELFLKRRLFLTTRGITPVWFAPGDFAAIDAVLASMWPVSIVSMSGPLGGVNAGTTGADPNPTLATPGASVPVAMPAASSLVATTPTASSPTVAVSANDGAHTPDPPKASARRMASYSPDSLPLRDNQSLGRVGGRWPGDPERELYWSGRTFAFVGVKPSAPRSPLLSMECKKILTESGVRLMEPPGTHFGIRGIWYPRNRDGAAMTVTYGEESHFTNVAMLRTSADIWCFTSDIVGVSGEHRVVYPKSIEEMVRVAASQLVSISRQMLKCTDIQIVAGVSGISDIRAALPFGWSRSVSDPGYDDAFVYEIVVPALVGADELSEPLLAFANDLWRTFGLERPGHG